mmetsp:Transcript_24169/g.43032  ORF Transcript_24169/g.43032 Transcript_24169/m.43032 type:complete len:389 (-) Transcript_24169:1164-2330(-)
MASFAQNLAATLTSHAWSPESDQLAVCPSSTKILIYTASPLSPKGWKRTATLQKHEQLVSGLDWSPVSGQRRLFSCSYDRTAHVWTFQDASQEWTPKIVLLRHDRAALTGKWSPSGNLIAVGSGSKTVCVCYYDTSNDWWACKVIRRRHESSVVALAWHPDSPLLATASTDGKFRVFNANIGETDSAGQAPTCLSDKFGERLLEVDCNSSWVHDVAWSLNGSKLAACSHNCTVFVVDGLDVNVPESFTQAASDVATVTLTTLPLKSILFVSESILVGAGFDAKVFTFTCEGPKQWAQHETVDEKVSPDKVKGYQGYKRQSFVAKLGMFKSQVETGESGKKERLNEHIVHKQPIFGMKLLSSSGRFSTCGLDGQIGLWNIQKMIASLQR